MSKASSTSLALGLPFLVIGFALGAGTKNWAVGLPFLVLGLVFFIQGLRPDTVANADDDGHAGGNGGRGGGDPEPPAQ